MTIVLDVHVGGHLEGLIQLMLNDLEIRLMLCRALDVLDKGVVASQHDEAQNRTLHHHLSSLHFDPTNIRPFNNITLNCLWRSYTPSESHRAADLLRHQLAATF